MSTFKVEIVKIESVTPHPNADRLDLLKIKDWQCVSAKGQFQPGDLAVYFPIDSLLPSEVETKIFGIDSKVKLTNSRVRTIKLRGALSQGLVIKPEIIGLAGSEGLDLTSTLNITKYEPPTKLNSFSNNQQTSKKQTNPHFNKYTGIENAKNFPSLFLEMDEVSVTEKIHGTNFRAGWVPFFADTLWKRLKQWLGFAPKWEFAYGSHNVQLQSKMLYTGYYDKNVYAEAVVKYSLPKILKPGEVIYGEIYGDGIQKGYPYGCNNGERKAVFFDLKIDGVYVNPDTFFNFARERDLPFVPELYRGFFNKEEILKLRDGNSVLVSSQKVREGVVVKSLKEEMSYMGRKMLKYISDEYLLKNQDEESEPH